MLEKIKRFMQVHSSRGGFRVAQLGITKKVSLHLWVVFVKQRAQTRTAVTPHMFAIIRLAGEI